MAHYLQCFESALSTHQQGPGFSFLMARTYVSENRVPLDPLANHHSSQWQWPCLGMFGVYNPCSDTHHMDMMLSPWYLHVSWWNPPFFTVFLARFACNVCFLLTSSASASFPRLFSAAVALKTSARRVRRASALVACQFSSSPTHPYYPYPSHPNVKWTIKHTR